MKEVWAKEPDLEIFVHREPLLKDTRYKWSAFAFMFDKDGRSFIYHTLTIQCIEVEKPFSAGETYSCEQVQEDASLYELQQNCYLVPEKKDETAFYLGIYRLMRLYKQKKGYSGYSILPTWACNARCVYCYEEGLPRVTMSGKVIDQTISYILDTRQPGAVLKFSWFGGEPLLHEAAIDRICEAMEKNGVGYRSVITTNGSLLSAARIKKMAEKWKVKQIQLSMDCAEAEYKKRKQYVSYQDTYRHVIRSVNDLIRYGIKPVIRCNVDEENIGDFPEFLSDLAGIIEKKDQVVIDIVLLLDVRDKDIAFSLRDKIRDARIQIKEKGFQAVSVDDTLKFICNHCMADHPEGSVAIAPNGDLYACEYFEPGSSFGNVAEGVTRGDILADYRDVREPEEKCRACVFLPRCTPFSRCPLRNSRCKEVMMRHTLEILYRRIDRIYGVKENM